MLKCVNCTRVDFPQRPVFGTFLKFELSYFQNDLSTAVSEFFLIDLRKGLHTSSNKVLVSFLWDQLFSA